MRKFLLAFLLFASFGAAAQNLQTHYDFGKDRGYLTTTLEMFKPDKLGNTFFFVDMDYNTSGSKGVTLSYWEIARVFKTDKMPIGIHAEYNGGLGRGNAGVGGDYGFELSSAFLGGVDYSVNAADFSKGFSVKALYKHLPNNIGASFQVTGVWYWNFLNDKMSFQGFADFWKEDVDFNFDGTADAGYIFLTEPQIWYHINKSFAVGGELEMSNNFANNDGFMINPTLGLKWTM